MPLRKEVDLEKTVAAASGVFRDVCSEEPPYHTAEELWEGLKQGDEGARLLFVFFLRLRKNERTRCSVEKAIAAEGNRWVGVLIVEAWRLYLLMRHRAVPYQGKPKSVVAVEGSRAQRRILARSGLARYSAPSLKEKAAVRLQTTWNKIHQQWVVLWMDNWYNKQFTTNPDKNDKSLNATALAVLLLKDAPRYRHGHRSLEKLERRVPVVARMLGNTKGTFARILCDRGFASTRPVVRNIRVPLDIIRPVPAKRPHWRPPCLSKEKVSGNISLLNLLQFNRDLAQHTRPVVPVLCDENIHYRICKMMYGEKTTGWNVRLFLRSHPIKKVPTRTGPCCTRSAITLHPQGLAPHQGLHFPKKKKKTPSHEPLQYPSTIQIGSTLRASVQHTGCLTVAGMYKNCTKEEALKLAYEHKKSKVGERWKHTQSQP